MKTAILATITVLLLAFPASGAEVSAWKASFDGVNGGSCGMGLSNNGARCSALLDGAGNTPMISVACPSATISVTDDLSVKPYKCRDSTLANCTQLKATNLRTGTFEDVVLDATDWAVLRVPFTYVTAEYVSGDGIVIIECGG